MKNSFIKKAQACHGEIYDYSLVNYKNNRSKIEIVCSRHGTFSQRPTDHLSKKGCVKCGLERGHEKQTKNLLEFIEDANIIHLNYYDYSNTKYVNNKIKVKIICPKHGEFKQRPNDHLGGAGCPRCFNKNEARTGKILQDIFKIKDLKSQKRVGDFRVDYFFIAKGIKYVIEYNGKQHYEPVKFGNLTEDQARAMFHKQVIRDEKLRKYCQENCIELIEIDGREYTGSRIKDYLIEKLLL